MTTPSGFAGYGRAVHAGIIAIVAILIAALGGHQGDPQALVVAGSSNGSGTAGTPDEFVEEVIPGENGDGTGDGTSSGDGSDTSSGGGGTRSQGSGGRTPTGSGGGNGGGGGGGSTGGPTSVTGSDRTGVTDSAINIGLHAPVTGAAPLPSTSFEKSGDLYWRYVTGVQKKKVLGRSKVNLTFADDKYTPGTAIQVCRQLADSNFLLVGGGGTDQLQACGTFANQARVPYLSPGVTEAGLRGLSWYYAISLSYKQQGPLLAQYVAKNFPGKKTAMIVTDTPNFDDAVEGWESGVQASGVNYYRTLKHPKGEQGWYNSFGSELESAGVEVIYVLTSPLDYIQFAQQNPDRGFQYVGVGVTMGLNAVLTGCPDVNGGRFFSPFPALDWARQNVPQFFTSAQDFGVPSDDIAFLLWGLNAGLDQMFTRYEAALGTDLTREDFRALLEHQQGLETGISGPISYSPQDHFGGSQVHVIQADCAKDEYVTLETFKAGF